MGSVVKPHQNPQPLPGTHFYKSQQIENSDFPIKTLRGSSGSLDPESLMIRFDGYPCQTERLPCQTLCSRFICECV